QLSVIAPNTPSPLVIGAVSSIPSSDARVTTRPLRSASSQAGAKRSAIRSGAMPKPDWCTTRNASASSSASAMATVSQPIARRGHRLLELIARRSAADRVPDGRADRGFLVAGRRAIALRGARRGVVHVRDAPFEIRRVDGEGKGVEHLTLEWRHDGILRVQD